MAEKLVYGIGSEIKDINVTMPQDLWPVFASTMESAAKDLKIPPLSADKDHEDLLFPHIQKFVEEHKNRLGITEQKGGSIPNAFEAARLTLEDDEAKATKFYQTVTTHGTTYNILDPTTGRKVVATFRPKEDIRLTKDDREAIARANVVFLIKSAINGKPGLVAEIVAILKNEKSSAPVLVSAHGSDEALYPGFMREIADGLVGDKNELFLKPEDMKSGLQIVMEKNGGITLHNQCFEKGSKFFEAPAVSQEGKEKDANDIGDGNIVEGMAIGAFLRYGKDGVSKYDLEKTGYKMVVGRAIGKLFAGATLNEKWAQRIKEEYDNLSRRMLKEQKPSSERRPSV